MTLAGSAQDTYNGLVGVIGNKTNDRDAALLTPLTVALTNFFVIKAVFSQQDNHPLYFMMLGMLVALVWRSQQQQATAKAAAAESPAPAYGAPRRLSRPAVRPDRP